MLRCFIGLASELLIGRYELPPSTDPANPIAQHECSLFSEAEQHLRDIGGMHRSEKFNRDMLPICLPLVQAIAHRMACEAAREAEIDSRLISLYESGVILEDSAWYTEQFGISRWAQREMEAQAADSLLPDLEKLVASSGAAPYSNAAITTASRWNEFVSGLETFVGEAAFDMTPLRDVES